MWTEGDASRFEVYQAQGMVMVHLGVGAAEALSRLRAYAYARTSAFETWPATHRS